MPHPPSRLVPLGTVALLLLSACGGGSGSTGGSVPSGAAAPDTRAVKAGGSLVLGLAEDPDALDPTLARSLVGREVFANMCEKLYDIDATLAIVPQLARALPTTSADGKTVTIPVRQGVTFNDGTPLDAAAVKASLDRDLTLQGSGRKSELGSVASVTVVDPKTVQINLKAPFAPLTGVLADRAGMVMSPTQLTKLGANFGSSPVCVGPFSFVSRQPGNEIVLKKSTNYYDSDKVKLDQVTYRIITDPNVRLANVRSRDVQVAERIAPTDIAGVQADKALRLVTGDPLGYQGISINIGNTAGVGKPVGTAPTTLAKSKDLRKAFELSLDRDTLNKVAFAGQYVPACFPLAPGSPYLDNSLTCSKHDVAAAKQLVASSGVPTPVPVTLMTATDPQTLRVAQIIQGFAKEAGFDVKVAPTEFAASLDASDAGKFDAFAVGWSGRVDPDGNITDFLTTGGARNISGYSNPQVDAALATGRASSDTAARKAAYTQAMRLAADDRPIIYLYYQRNFLVSTEKVAGIAFYADGLPRLKTAGFTA